jgi:hypothetical protein
MFKIALVASLITLTVNAAPVRAHSPVEFLEVVQGEPSNLIEHGVELQSFFDEQRVTTELEGPYYFSLSVGGMGREVKKEKAYLAWYKIVGSKPEETRKVSVLDLVRGGDIAPMTIESAEYFLSPAQRITSGPPSEIPEGLDHYKAYRIADAPSHELDLQLGESSGAKKRTVGKARFLCVATDEWHHDEHFPASHRQAGFVVYELDPQEHSQQIGMIDQFGLNQISTNSSRWLCVRAVLLSKGAKQDSSKVGSADQETKADVLQP